MENNMFEDIVAEGNIVVIDVIKPIYNFKAKL